MDRQHMFNDLIYLHYALFIWKFNEYLKIYYYKLHRVKKTLTNENTKQ